MKYIKTIKASCFKKYNTKQAYQRAYTKAHALIEKYKEKGLNAEVVCAGEYFNHVRVFVAHD